ncbi:hypothetical protein QQ045_003164 [Rhodiola kirilowii]
MQEEIGPIQVTSKSFSRNNDDLQVELLSELRFFDAGSPIVGVVVNYDDVNRSKRDEDSDDDDDNDFEFTFSGVFDHQSDWFRSTEVFPIFDRRLLSEIEAHAIQIGQQQMVPAMRKKSSWTRSMARRWGVSLKDMLIGRGGRSDNGSGKGSFVRLKSWRPKAESRRDKAEEEASMDGNVAAKGGGEKRRSAYLPYAKAIVAFGFYRM